MSYKHIIDSTQSTKTKIDGVDSSMVFNIYVKEGELQSDNGEELKNFISQVQSELSGYLISTFLATYHHLLLLISHLNQWKTLYTNYTICRG